MRCGVFGLVVIFAFATQARAETAPEKSPLLAVSLSVGVTAAGVVALVPDHDGLRAAGALTVFLGPSVGRWYAGESSVSGLGLRALGAATLIAGFAIEAQRSCDDLAPCGGPEGGAVVLMVGGATLWLGSTIADTVFAHRAARRWNARRALTLAPTAFRSGATYAPGLALGGRF